MRVLVALISAKEAAGARAEARGMSTASAKRVKEAGREEGFIGLVCSCC
jgi:hypothetical protein